MAQPRRGNPLTARRAKLAARILFQAESGKTDTALAAEHHVGARSIYRWRQREAAGEIPEVTAELKRLRAASDDIVRSRAEQVLEHVYNFLERATKGDPKDPRMVEAMVKAGEFLNETLTVGRMIASVPSPRPSPTNRTEARPVGGVAGGAQPAAGAGSGRTGGAGGSGPGATGTAPVH